MLTSRKFLRAPELNFLNFRALEGRKWKFTQEAGAKVLPPSVDTNCPWRTQ